MKIKMALAVSKPKKKMSRIEKKENVAGWMFISLNLIGYFLFKLIPILLAGGLSFAKWNIASDISQMEFVGLDNFVKMLSDNVFWASVKNTLIYTFIMAPVAIFLSLIFAVILDKYVFGKGFLRLAFYLPNISSMVAVAIVWMILFLPSYGPINNFLYMLGVHNPPKWLNGTSTALISIIIVGVWQRIGYNIIIVLAGLQGISRSLYEAAEIDGANAIQRFRYITIPGLNNTLFFLTIMSIINSFQVFTPVKVMTQGGPGTSTSVLVYYIYKSAFQNNNIGYASAMAWVLFGLVFIASAIRMLVSKKKD